MRTGNKELSVVYIVNGASILGGAEKVARQEAIGMAQRGASVVLFSAVDPATTELEAAGVKVVSLGQKLCSEDPSKIRGFYHGLWNVTAERRILSVLSKLDPSKTIVHLHTWTHSLSASILRPIRKLGFRLVVTAHDYFLVCPNGGLFDYRNLKKCGERPPSIRCLFRNCDKRSYSQKLYRYVRWKLQRHELRRMRKITVVTISDIGERLIRERADGSGLSDASFLRIPNPVENLNPDKRRGGCPFPNDSFFLYVGRMSVEKGPQLLAQAARGLSHKVVFIGDGPLLNELVEKSFNCVFLGRMSFDEMIPYYIQARALVIPSLWYEGLSLAACEGRVLGTSPIVVPTNCAAADAAGHMDDEFSFESGNEKALAELLRHLDDDSQLDAARRKRVEPVPALSEKDHIDRLVVMYEGILGEDG